MDEISQDEIEPFDYLGEAVRLIQSNTDAKRRGLLLRALQKSVNYDKVNKKGRVPQDIAEVMCASDIAADVKLSSDQLWRVKIILTKREFTSYLLFKGVKTDLSAVKNNTTSKMHAVLYGESRLSTGPKGHWFGYSEGCRLMAEYIDFDGV